MPAHLFSWGSLMACPFPFGGFMKRWQVDLLITVAVGMGMIIVLDQCAFY